MAQEKADARPFEIWTLPEVLLYHISQFATPQTGRASFFCHKLALLNKASCKTVLEEEKSVALWDLVLCGDYGVSSGLQGRSKRASKRLKRSLVGQVRDAHKLLKDNTEIAYFYVSEHCNSSAKTNCLTKGRLCGLINEYGPHLMINKAISSGGTFLVEVCRARNVKKTTILQCVQELVEKRGALVDQKTSEASNSALTAISVAAVRGLPNVVKYLLSKGANPDIRCSGRFRLSSNSRKSLRCIGSAAEFAQSMLDAELKEGATHGELVDLQKCVKLLSPHSGAASARAISGRAPHNDRTSVRHPVSRSGVANKIKK
mmetsp:Transcript_39273/g.95011  ORF Transcript_39273/g.95011 Transcript_39273/m.95011 type:complete len:317 (-) Transcript_39273:41-991(-)